MDTSRLSVPLQPGKGADTVSSLLSGMTQQSECSGLCPNRETLGWERQVGCGPQPSPALSTLCKPLHPAWLCGPVVLAPWEV